tara:strand:- start:2002 stop:2208 length:207 start_codon:yes stop_codon:yes gene_type:complete
MVDINGYKININDRVRVEEDMAFAEGMLYKNSIVKIDEVDTNKSTARVVDSLGKVWWVNSSKLSIKFL